MALGTAGTCRPGRGAVRGCARSRGPLQLAIGFVTNFFDTLGVGSFAPTTSIYKLLRLVPDERIPGTLNAGHALPTVAQAFIFIAAVSVDPITLVTMIGAAVLGAWLGSGVVARLPRRAIQLGMGAALLVAAALFVLGNVGWIPAGGEALALEGVWLGVRHRLQFPAGSVDDAGRGTVRALPDPGQLVRHESHRRLSHHDGLVRLPHAGGGIALHRGRAL